MLRSLLLELLPTVTELDNLKLVLTGKKKPKPKIKKPTQKTKTAKQKQMATPLTSLNTNPQTNDNKKRKNQLLIGKGIKPLKNIFAHFHQRPKKVGHGPSFMMCCTCQCKASKISVAISSKLSLKGWKWEFCMAFERGWPPYLQGSFYKEITLTFLA